MRAYSDKVLAASEQLLDVVNETLEISRMEAGHVQLELDRQLCLPPEVTVNIRAMVYPRVGVHECHFWIPVGSAA